MLDPREVRPGNWVLKITGTDRNTRSFFEYNAIELQKYNFSFLKGCLPIKISPIILERSGFTHDEGDWYINMDPVNTRGGFPFLRYRNADQSWYLKEIKIWAQPVHLHQLQNLYHALTHRELEIQLGHFENISMVSPIDFFIKPIRKEVRIMPLL
jgi:hypothetical protein